MSENLSAIELYWERHGTGDPVLALHGFGTTLYSWRHLKGQLPNNELILVDLKGSGRSPKPRDGQYSVQEQADLIHRFVVKHDLKNLTLMGNSYGGAVALLIAIRLCREEPGRLTKLILIDSAGYDEDLPWHLRLLRTPILGWLSLYLIPPRVNSRSVLIYAYYSDSLITKEQITAYAEPIGSVGGRYALLQIAKQCIPNNIDEIIDQYPTISVPTLIVWGANDRVIPIKIGTKLNKAILGSKLVCIKKTGHAPQEESPRDLIPIILDFLTN